MSPTSGEPCTILSFLPRAYHTSQSADHLEMPKRSLDDILYRAYIALDAKNFDDAVDKLGLKSKYSVKKNGGDDELSRDSA